MALSLEARGQLLDNPDLFISHYFRDQLENLKDFHLRLIQNATREKKGLTLYPAGHGKTTINSTKLPIWAVCDNPDVRLGMIFKNDIEAKNVARAIMSEFMGNQELIRDFGPFKPEGDDTKPWALEAMSVHHRTLRAKEPTIGFFGSGSKAVLGYRTNWTICDDVINEKNSATPEQRAKVREWFNQSVNTMNLPGGRTSVVGTLFDPEDLYHDLVLMLNPETGKRIWTVQREDAIVEMCTCGHPVTEHNNRACVTCVCDDLIVDESSKISLWPEWWPWAKLMEQKAAMGTLDFNKRYRNIAVDKSSMVFREEYVKGGYIGQRRLPGCLDDQYAVGDYDPSWRRVAGYDPAIGVYRTSRFCAHVTLAMGTCAQHERCLWVVDLEHGQYTLPQQVELILNKHEQYNLWSSVIEANSFQQGLLDQIQKEMGQAGLAYNVEPHFTNRSNKPDPELGVASFSRWFENGWVHIPWANAESQRKMRVFIDELVMWPANRTDDTVMAFWFAARKLIETAPKYKSFNRLQTPKPTTWGKRVSNRVIRNPAYAALEAD